MSMILSLRIIRLELERDCVAQQQKGRPGCICEDSLLPCCRLLVLAPCSITGTELAFAHTGAIFIIRLSRRFSLRGHLHYTESISTVYELVQK